VRRERSTPRYAITLALLTLALAVTAGHGTRAQDESTGPVRPVQLLPTAHPPLPPRVWQYWFVPDASDPGSAARARWSAAEQRFARAVRMIGDGQYAAAVPLLTGADLAATPLGAYAQYYKGVSLLAMSRYAEADAAFAAALDRRPDGYLREALPLRVAETAIGRQDPRSAVSTLKDLVDDKVSAPEEAWLRLGRAAELAGNRDEALKAYRRLYYDFPLSAQAGDAQAGLERLQTVDTLPADRFKQELGRAEKLFAAKRWAQARAAFEPLARVAQGDDAELTALRLAECDYYLDRFRQARQALTPYLDKASRKAEARFFYLTATRAMGDQDTYVTLAHALVTDFPDSPWAEETLNNLASHYIIVDDDADADAVFRDLSRRFPHSRYAERAAWKIGWLAYRDDDFAEAAETFEQAAAAFPRADNRPAWLYWSGRARDRMGDQATAAERYRLTVADYENSYYGRLASAMLSTRGESGTIQNVAFAKPVETVSPVPSADVIRELVGLELYDDALREIQYAQRVFGDSAQLMATSAFIRNQQGQNLTAFERFNAIRGAITMMRRAYPQFLAAGGENLPPDVLRIIFPLDYWPLITKYSQQHDLDPYLVAALMAQESTFTAEIRSSANAYGLMQLVPAAGRQYARKLGIRRFSTAMLMQPETNVRMGTLYFKDLSDKFGGAYFALASYNAGPNRVAAWLQERGGLDQDEFIDDIPFPETQNYVKRILGTAEDYRRLYGGGLLDPNSSEPRLAPASATRATTPAAKVKAPAKTKAKAKAKPKAKAAAPKKTTVKKPAAKAPAKSTAKRPARRTTGR
jgi:soluble lytic murein transglycosylase